MEAFIANLIPQDYILFGASFVLFILFIVLAIILKNKKFIAILLFLLAFSIIIFGPTLGYVKMHEFLFANKTKITSQKKLTFTKAVVVYGELSNESKNDFSLCKIKANAYRVSSNKYKNYIYKFKPFQNMSILEYDISKGQTIEFKIILEPFMYSKDYNISLQASCR